ncbi:MAG: hypothetical protein JWR09_2576 [Mucilaginibacter sp.]|nr:hypothetical protein [Mucilaginibacter sp.]
MAIRKFSIGEDLILTELHSGMQLEMVTDQESDEALSWIEGWFELPNGHLVIQKFIVLEMGQPTYQLANDALAFWGKEVLDAQLSSVQLSPEFGNLYLLTEVMQHYQTRWN